MSYVSIIRDFVYYSPVFELGNTVVLLNDSKVWGFVCFSLLAAVAECRVHFLQLGAQ